jgi:phenylacetate-CoA ligase
MERLYWNPQIESILNTPRMREIQLARLRKHIAALHKDSPVLRKRLDGLGVKPGDIRSLADFQKKVPPVTKDDIRVMMMESFTGDVLDSLCSWGGIGRERLRVICSTSGTTGEPVPYLLTNEDLELTHESFARAFWLTGFKPMGVAVHAMALSMYLAGLPLVQSVQQYGACVIPIGAEGGSDRLLQLVQLFRPDALFCTPSYAEYLLEKIGHGARKLGLQRVICGGEPGAGLPEVRRRLEEGYGARVFDFQGAGPVMFCSCDSKEYQGMHFVTEDTAILELVDPATKEPLALEDGAVGEWVVTPLAGRMTAVLRYAVGDIFQVFTSPCPCGRSSIRIKVLGRVDDMLKVKGVLVYPAAISEVIHSFVPEVTGVFRIVLDEPPPRVVPPLQLKIEHGEGMKEEELRSLGEKIRDAMHNTLKITPTIGWVRAGTFERAKHKASYFEKAY